MPDTSEIPVAPSHHVRPESATKLVGPGVHIPALDGLRGVAVVAVVAYHLWPDIVPGGWLGVSLFFTLSGFLVVGLIDDDLSAGSVDLGHFYRRRIRRLLPAGLVAIGVVVLATALFEHDSAQRVAVDGFWAVLNSANWHQMAGSDGYGAIFDQTVRPLAHMWSLAIEEQFYLTIPLLIAWWKKPVAVAIGGGAVALIGQVIWWGSPDSYFASPVRFAEIVAGAGLALAVRRRPQVISAARLWPLAAVAGLWAVMTASESSAIVFHGLPALISVAWVVLTAACLRAGLFSRAMSNGVLRWLGLRSYAIYLFHWPLIALTDFNPITIIVLTLFLAEASHRLIEDPVRRERRVSRPVLTLVGGGLLLAAASGIAGITLDGSLGLANSAEAVALPAWATTTTEAAPAAVVSTAQTVAPASAPRSTEATTTTTTTTTTLPAVPAVPIVAVMGDSTAAQIAAGLRSYGDATHDIAVIDGSVSGCSPLIDALTNWRSYKLTYGYLGEFDFDKPCRGGLDTLSAVPDLVMIVDHGSAMADHQRVDGTWASILDPDLMADLQLVYEASIAEARSVGAVVVFTTAPQILDPKGHGLFGNMTDPTRLAAYNSLVAALADEHPGVVVFDLGLILDRSGVDGSYPRSDGLHVDLDATEALAAHEIAPNIDDWLRHPDA